MSCFEERFALEMSYACAYGDGLLYVAHFTACLCLAVNAWIYLLAGKFGLV